MLDDLDTARSCASARTLVFAGLVLKEDVLLATAGIALGSAMASLVGGLLGRLLFEVPAIDGVTLVGAATLFEVVGAVAVHLSGGGPRTSTRRWPSGANRATVQIRLANPGAQPYSSRNSVTTSPFTLAGASRSASLRLSRLTLTPPNEPMATTGDPR